MKLSIIIPAYNEEKSIAEAIHETMRYFNSQGFEFEVLVVDDGSHDKTREIVRQKQIEFNNLKLIINNENRGKGYSVRQGVLNARGEWIVFMDADLSTEPKEFEKFKPYFNDYDILIGSRAVRGAVIIRRQSAIREFIGKLANKVIRLYLGLPYNDTQCGFKIFNKRTKIIFEKQKLNRWLFDAELLYLAKKHTFRVREAPIIWSNDPTTLVKITDILTTIKELYFIKKYHGS